MVGGENAVTMIADLEDKEAFDAYMVHPYHEFIKSINGTEDDCFITSELYSAQIEC